MLSFYEFGEIFCSYLWKTNLYIQWEHTYPEIWKKYCDDTRLRFCVGIDLCHILVGKNQKNKYFPQPLLRYRNFKIWRPLKQTKSKNGRHFFLSTFENLQLCFFVQKDSTTLRVLKMQFVFGLAYDKGHCIFNRLI